MCLVVAVVRQLRQLLVCQQLYYVQQSRLRYLTLSCLSDAMLMLILLSAATFFQLFYTVGTALSLSSTCSNELGMESGKILDYQLSASSSDGRVVGPENVNIMFFIKIFKLGINYMDLTEDTVTVRNPSVCKVNVCIHHMLLRPGGLIKYSKV